MKAETVICRARGCKLRHPDPCSHYEQGRCSFGERCALSHVDKPNELKELKERDSQRKKELESLKCENKKLQADVEALKKQAVLSEATLEQHQLDVSSKLVIMQEGAAELKEEMSALQYKPIEAEIEKEKHMHKLKPPDPKAATDDKAETMEDDAMINPPTVDVDMEEFTRHANVGWPITFHPRAVSIFQIEDTTGSGMKGWMKRGRSSKLTIILLPWRCLIMMMNG